MSPLPDPIPGGAGDPVVVWGAGAMGGSVGAWLHLTGREVVLVDADARHVEAIRQNGLRITGPVAGFTRRVPAYLPGEATKDLSPFRTVLLAVKAHHTAGAVAEIAPHLAPDGCVVSVQNGLNERTIAAAVGEERTVGCFVNFGADVVEPGVVMRGNRGAVVVGELDGRATPRIRSLHSLFLLFEPDAVLTDDIHGYLWGKLAYGALLFATALTDAPIADVLASADHRPGLVALVREVCAVAAAQGVQPCGFDGFDPGPFAPVRHPAGRADAENGPGAAPPAAVEDGVRATLDALVAFNRASAKSHSGVWRDLAVRKRKTEVDAQIAVVSELGSEVGVATPLLDRLVELVHDVEEERRPLSWATLDELVRAGGR